MQGSPKGPAEVLIVDDTSADAESLRRALATLGIINPVAIKDSGESAIAYFESQSAPALAFVDLRMPRVSGLEVLRWIQSHKEIKTCTVLVTGFQDMESIREAYRLGAHSFLFKPIALEELRNVTSGISCLRSRKLNPTETVLEFTGHLASPDNSPAHPGYWRTT